MRKMLENPDQAKAYLFLNPEDKFLQQKLDAFKENPQETLLKEAESLMSPYQMECYKTIRKVLESGSIEPLIPEEYKMYYSTAKMAIEKANELK